jgi:transposase IS66 family protein
VDSRETVVWRWQDHLPLYRIERIFGRQGLPLARSTICGWHAELAELVRPLVTGMWDDAFTAPYLCADATGVLVQAKEKCRNGHFFVVAAPERHVLAAYTPKQNADVVGALLAGYKGTLVVDAHAVYDHLFESAHRRSVPDRARPRDRTSRTAARDAQARGGAHHREVLRLVRCRGRARARRDSIGEGHRLLAQPARGAHALPRGRAHPDTQQLLRT